MAGALRARTNAKNLEPLMRDGGGQEEVNRNGGNRNGEIEIEEMEIERIEMEETEMVMGTEEEMAITLEDLCLLETGVIVYKMVTTKEDKVERFVGGLPDNIQGNVIAAEPTKLQDEIHVSNNLMDQKLKGYARSQNVARAYTAENNEKKGPVHFRKYCPKLRNQNHGNKTRNKNGNKTGNQTGSNEATTKAYAIGGGGSNPDSNVGMGTFLLNNCYASMLFDSGADWSFVSSTFSALFDVAPSTLDTSYAVELPDGRISETNVLLRGCTLGLL
ncbi:hypothetical protein Tco_0093668 [Tanacetum coccineum]